MHHQALLGKHRVERSECLSRTPQIDRFEQRSEAVLEAADALEQRQHGHTPGQT